MSNAGMAPVDIEDAAGRLPTLSCTTVASFASSQAQCARFLALTYHEQLQAEQDRKAKKREEAEQDRKAKRQDKHDKKQGQSEEHGVAEQPNDTRHNSQHKTPGPIDSCRLAGGTALEDYWGRELSKNARQLLVDPESRNALGRCTWAAFCNALQPGVRAFAAEVELNGQPHLSDSRVPGVCLSGGADFIEVQWDKESKCLTLHIYECKATSQLQASHLLQVVLYYYMLIKKRLQQQGGLKLAKAMFPLDCVGIQCHLIRGDLRGFRVVGHDQRTLPQDEVNYLQGSLSSLLERGGSSLVRISHLHQHVLRDPLEPPLSFCVGAHCSTCSMQDKCVARLERNDGELQLSGCAAEQADKMHAYRDETHKNGITSLCALASTSLETLRLALGLERGSPVPEVLQARARVRKTRTDQGRMEGSDEEVKLRPRAGPSTLPKPGTPETRGLVQVFLSVIVDCTFEKEGSVAGLAAYVVGGQQDGGCPNLFSELITDDHGTATNQHGKTTEMVHAKSSRGPAKHSSVPAVANTLKPAGQSTIPPAINESKPAKHSAVPTATESKPAEHSSGSAVTNASRPANDSKMPAAANKSKPAKHGSVPAAAEESKPVGQSTIPAAAPPSAATATEALAVPSTQPSAAAAAAAAAATEAPAPALPSTQPSSSSAAAAAAANEAPAPALPPPSSSSSAAAAAAAAAEAAHYEDQELGLLLSFLSRLRTTLEKNGKDILLHFHVHSNRQLRVLLMRCMRLARKHTSSCSSIARQLMWLPELLGQRAGIPGEQQMHSVLEVEMCRFVTKWEEKDLATATQQEWLPGRGTFPWDGFGWPLSSDPPGCAQNRKLCDGMPPTLLWLAFHRSRNQEASASTSNHGDTNITSTGGTSSGNAGSTCKSNQGSTSNRSKGSSDARSTSAHASGSNSDPHGRPSEFHESCRSSIPDLDDLVLGLRKAATPARLHALLEQNVKAMRWLSDSMVSLGATPQMRVEKHSISLPLIEGAAVRPAAAAAPAPAPAPAAATDERVAFCKAARDAALLCRATEIHDFMVDRIFSRTPLQRALEDRDTSLIVWEQKQEGKAAYVLPPGLTSGCLRKLPAFSKDKDKVKYRLESLWDLHKGDSFWLSWCSRPGALGLECCQQLKDVLNNGLPLSVPLFFKKQHQHQQQPDLEVSNLPESSIYSVKEQPYFLVGSSTPGFDNGAQAAILERTGINIAGYTLKNVCKRLDNREDRDKVLSAAELLMLPPETDLPGPNKDCASEPPHFLEKQKTMQELLPIANIMKKDQRKALNKDNKKTSREGQRKGKDKDERKAFNEGQKKALAWVLAPETRLQLLQGPPGTGKTETMATAILLAAAAALRQLRDQEEKNEGGEEPKQLKGQLILVSANTRGAVKELKQRITGLRDQLCNQDQQNAVFVEYQTKDAEERLEEKGNKRQCQAQTSEKKPCSNGAKLCSRYCGIKKHRESDEAPTVYILCGTPKYLLDLFEEEDGNVLKWLDIGASWLFIDEGSQMPLPTLLALASMLQPNVGQVFVGGDHRQLPCIQTYDSSSDLRPSFLRYLPFSSAYGCLLEIQHRTPASGSPRVAVSRLEFSHRLPPILRHLISPIYERDEIRLDGHGAAAASGSSSTAAAAAAGLSASAPAAAAPAAAAAGGSGASTSGIPDPLRAAFRAIRHAPEGLFLVLHNSSQDGKRNPLELRLIERMLAEWHGIANGGGAGAGAGAADGGGTNGDLGAATNGGGADGGVPGGAGKKPVGIISPHKLQCADWQALVASLDAPHLRGVEAKTVDGYQGQEAASIIFSSTVSDLAAMSSNEEFYSSAHRVTVAFSRAMRRLVVVCSKRLLNFLPARAEAYDSMLLWRRLRAMCKDKGMQLGRGEVEGMDVSVFQGEGRLVV